MSPGWSPNVREFSCWLLKMAFGPMHGLKLLSQMLSNSDALLQTEVFAGIFSFSDGFAVVRLLFQQSSKNEADVNFETVIQKKYFSR